MASSHLCHVKLRTADSFTPSPPTCHFFWQAWIVSNYCLRPPLEARAPRRAAPPAAATLADRNVARAPEPPRLGKESVTHPALGRVLAAPIAVGA